MDIFDGRYEQEKLLGQGAFSEVWKVRDTQTGVALALKIYNPTGNASDDGNEMLTHEFALMVNANHKNLLRPLFFATSGNRPYLILPYCEQGNIGKMIGKMTEDEAWKLIRDCASALAYLHEMKPPIVHQDIKPANILLSDNGDYMLTDFGVSTQAKQSLSHVSNQEKDLFTAGTISYMAPERFSKQNLPIMANDIYSLGSTVFEMLSGMLPFGNDGGLLQKKGAEIPELPGNFSPLLKRTLEKCLEAEPWDRPTANRLEDIAEKAIRYPETRNQIPDIFAATSQDEVVLRPMAEPKGLTPALGPKRNSWLLSIAIIAVIVAAFVLWQKFSDSKSEVVPSIPSADTIVAPRQETGKKNVDEPKPEVRKEDAKAAEPQPVKPAVASMSEYDLERMAMKGDAEAQCQLGMRWVNKGDSTNVVKGIKYLKQAAQNGSSEAKTVLNKVYATLQQSAAHGSTTASNILREQR